MAGKSTHGLLYLHMKRSTAESHRILVDFYGGYVLAEYMGRQGTFWIAKEVQK